MNMKTTLPILFLFVLTILFHEKSTAQSNPEICMVTVDANSTHNIIFYDKTNHGDAAFYIIYREDQSGNYIALDSIHKDTLSEFHDMTALVNVRAHKYKISLVDTFGVESNLSPYHRTVFCDEPTTGLFAWNWYQIEGQSNPSTDWVMLREDVQGSTGWNAIDTIPGTAVDFYDAAISSLPSGAWRVRNLWGLSCNSTRVGVNTSRSNVRNQSMAPSAIRELELYNFSVYPNPAADFINVTGIYYNEPYQITDMTGKVVATGVLNGVDPQFHVTDITDGLYLVTIRNASVKWFKN
jgi:hypothetical protein